MDEIKYIYLVIIPNDISKLIELKSFKINDYLRDGLCIYPNSITNIIGDTTYHVFFNRQAAIDKYCEERDKRIKEIINQINNLTANYYDQNNWNPYSIDGENEW